MTRSKYLIYLIDTAGQGANTSIVMMPVYEDQSQYNLIHLQIRDLIERYENSRVTSKYILKLILSFLVIAVAFVFYNLHSFFIILSIPLIGWSQHLLFIFVHDGSHQMISKSKIVNNMISEFAAILLMMEFQTFKYNHFAHHLYYNTDRDAELTVRSALGFPKSFCLEVTRAQFLYLHLRYLIGFGCVEFFYYIKIALQNSFRLIGMGRLSRGIRFPAYIMLWASVIVFLDIQGKFIWLWMFAYTFVFLPLNRVRELYEHYLVDDSEVYISRNLSFSVVDYCFVPVNNWHLMHHLFPRIPSLVLNHFYRELSKLLSVPSQMHPRKSLLWPPGQSVIKQIYDTLR